jgi:hypothetical protein
MANTETDTRQDADCMCRTAVTRAFGELRRRNMSERAALESAAAVYRFHHPDVPEAQALQTVRGWV